MATRDMTVIEAAIQQPQTTESTPAPQPDASMLPTGTPITDSVVPLKKKRTPRTKKPKEGQQPEEKPSEEENSQQPPTPNPEPLQEQQQTQAALSTMQQAINSARGIIRNAGVRLENIPTPGSIALPLILLLVFFFFLVPVNGHTRFTWLWLVISGDASTAIGGNVSSGVESRPNTSGNNTSGNNNALLAPIGNAPVPVMTGVEDV